VRRPGRAKAVVLFAATDENGKRARNLDVVLTITLSYQDGCWTTEQCEAASRGEVEGDLRGTFAFLMLAIDEAAEK
jgi:hypothetical protein